MAGRTSSTGNRRRARATKPSLDDVGTAHRLYAESRDPDLEAALVRLHGPLAVRLAERFSHRGVTPEDLRQVALLALLRALRSYDPDRGTQFSTYAVPSILGALERHFREGAWLVRPPRPIQDAYLIVYEAVEHLLGQLARSPILVEIADHTRLPVDDVVESLAAGGGRRAAPLDKADQHDNDNDYAHEGRANDGGGHVAAEDRLLVAELVRSLPGVERDVVVPSFFADLTQGQIARRLGTSQSTVSRVRRWAIERLRSLHPDEVSAA